MFSLVFLESFKTLTRPSVKARLVFAHAHALLEYPGSFMREVRLFEEGVSVRNETIHYQIINIKFSSLELKFAMILYWKTPLKTLFF